MESVELEKLVIDSVIYHTPSGKKRVVKLITDIEVCLLGIDDDEGIFVRPKDELEKYYHKKSNTELDKS